MKYALIYIRVSTDDQTKGTSLSTQEADCRAWCHRNGYTVAQVFRDEGESAKTADRPGLLAMLDRCRKGRVDALVCWKLDRLSRNTGDGLAIRAEIRKHGVRTYSATEAISDDPMGEMVSTILLSVAQFDNDVRSSRVTRAMRDIAQRGGWCHAAPVGYRLAKADNLPILTPDPVIGPIIAEAFTGLANHSLHLSQANAMMQAAGIPSQTCSSVLRRPIYGGIVKGPLVDGQEIPAAFPGLVTPDVWRLAQHALKHHPAHSKAGTAPAFPLAQVATCEVCGGPIKGSTSAGRGGRKYGYYDCRKGHVRARIETAHADLTEIITASYLPQVIDLRARVVRLAGQEAATRQQARAAIEARRTSAETRLSKITDAYADGILDPNTYRAKASQYRHDIALANQQIGAKTAGMDAMLASIDKVVETMSNPSEMWKSLGLLARRQFLEALGARLVIARDGRCRNTMEPLQTQGKVAAKDAELPHGRPPRTIVETAVGIIHAVLGTQAA